MGLVKETKKLQYLKLKDGNFFMKDDETPYSELSGMVKSVTLKTTNVEGTDIENLNICVESEGEKYVVSTNFTTQCALALVACLKSANINEPMVFVPILEKERPGADKRYSSILIKQGDVFLKRFFTKDAPNGMPPTKEMTLNGKTVYDKTERLAFLRNVVNNELNPSIKKDVVVETIAVGDVDIDDVVHSSTEDIDDDLPF